MSDCMQLQQWWTEAAWPGMGLFGESFDADVCHPKLVYSLSYTYTVVVGIILGMASLCKLCSEFGAFVLIRRRKRTRIRRVHSPSHHDRKLA
eukprot:scaffold116955_cov35-Attheya_sp.AAC.1